MNGRILTLNAGSSSIKFALFHTPQRCLARGEVENIGASPRLRVFDGNARPIVNENLSGGYEKLFDALIRWVDNYLEAKPLVAAGHRIVHGGSDFALPIRLNEEALDRLDHLAPLAPLHQPHNLAAVRTLAKLRPTLLQIGCFDTAFHSTIAETQRRFAVPAALEKIGLRRFGFHGLSYEFIASRLSQIDPVRAVQRIVVAHLGSGASLCAMHRGRSVDTTMSLTPLDGLMMGTRCGALDPGAVLFLLQGCGMRADQVEDLLYHHSGLLGVSGLSADMRVLLASDRPEAAQAVNLFVFRAVREIAAMAASLGGLDGLVFTGGIGENALLIRDRIVRALGWLGLELDDGANRAGARQITTPHSRIWALVIPTDEERMIAHHTWTFAKAYPA